jgi:hypothetical protein
MPAASSARREVDAAPASVAPHRPAPAVLRAPVQRRLLASLIVLAFLAQGFLLLRLNVNWDEFYFLSFVYDHGRGTLATPVQSFHVHLLGWLTRVGGQEVDQVIVGRAVLLLLLVATCGCVYALARRVASAEASLFAVLCCASYSNILYYGTSLRTDAIGVCLLMTALLLVQSTACRLVALSGAATIVALSLLITMKSVFLLPTIGIVLVASSWRERRTMRAAGEVTLFLAVLAIAGTALYLWHRSGVVMTSRPLSSSLVSIGDKVIRRNAFFPQWGNVQETIRGNLVQWAVLAYAVGVLVRRATARIRKAETVWLASLVLPLASLVFYRNSFPYFYVFIMPPALVLCALAFDAAAGPERRAPSDRQLARLATLALGVAVVAHAAKPHSDELDAARATIAAAHEIFPNPVPYIDRNGMIASYPKVGFFMSGWGLENYRAGQRPVFAELIRRHRPQFLIANVPALALPFTTGKGGGLFEEDIAVLRGSFVPYWGAIHVAGQRRHLPQDVDVTWEVLAEGLYLLESDEPVAINGVVTRPGATVALTSGPAVLRSPAAQDVVLRTAAARKPPSHAPPESPIYTGFPAVGSRIRAGR